MRWIEAFRSLSLRVRSLVVLSAAQWLIALVLLSISIVAVHWGSETGMTWDPQSGVIWNVIPDGPADRAGIREQDRLAAVEGVSITASLPLFYDVGPWTDVGLLVERNGRLIHFDLQTVSKWELRRRGFGNGASLAIRSVNEYLRIAVNLWILLLAGGILYLRPGHAQARVSSVALAYFAGGNALLDRPGIGRILGPLPEALEIGIHLADITFLVGFLALFVHFALIFPRPLPLLRRHRSLQIIPYLAGLPLVVLAALRLFRVLEPGFRSSLPPIHIDGLMRIYSPSMLLASISVLALHFRHEPLENDRRRLSWVLSSQIPPFLTWMVLLSLETVQAGMTVLSIARTIFWLGVAAGSIMFAWAIVRHRVFETRILLRKSIQYAFARGTLILIIAIPLAALSVFLWLNRYRSLAELMSSDLAVLLGILLPLAILLQYRANLLAWIDRRFFRDQYDSNQALVRLISMIQKGSDVGVLGRVTLIEIEKALYPTHISFWRLDPDRATFRASLQSGEKAATPALPSGSPVVRMMTREAEPVQIDLLYPAQSLRRHSTSGHFWIWLSVTRAALLVPILVEGELTGFLILGERKSEEPYSTTDRNLLQTVARQLAITEAYSRLEELARQDPLTAALNRHAYYSLIEKRGSRGDLEAGCVAIVDLDELKKINDTMGHAAGDLAIRQAASAVRAVLRADDLVFRWGGDEFLAILFGISEELGRDRLSGVNEYLASHGFPSAMPITVSIGIAPFANATELSSAIDEADRRMYENKVSRPR